MPAIESVSGADGNRDDRNIARMPVIFRHVAVKILMVACGYAALGWLGLQLAPPPGYASLIWPASGLAIACLTVFGFRAWPGVFLGAVAVNYFVSGSSLAIGPALINAVCIGLGSALQAVLGAYWIRKRSGYPLKLDGPLDALALTILVVPLTCVVSATVGTLAVFQTGVITQSALFSTWITWWSGDVGGVLIVLPLLLLSPWAGSKIRWRGTQLSPFSATAFIAILVLLAATLAAWRLNMQTAYDRSLSSFSSLASDSQQALLNRMESYRQALDGGAALFEATDNVNLQQWRTYTAVLDLDSTLPGISGIGYIEPVQASQLNPFLESVRRRGVNNLRIHPTTERNEKFIIVFIEPRGENSPAIGLDIAFEQNRYRAAGKARDTGKPTITQRIFLVQDETESAGFLLLRPLYKTGLPSETVAQRRAAFDGWIYAPFIAPRIMDSLTASQGDLLDLTIYDGAQVDPDSIIFSSLAPDARPHQPAYSDQRTFQVMGQPWTVVWTSTPRFEQGVKTYEAALVLAGGLLLTIFFATVLLAGSRREADVRKQVEERTLELEQTVSALAESERRFGDLAGLSPAGIFRTDPFGFCTYVNDAWLDVTGLSPSHALGAGWIDAVHPDSRSDVRQSWLEAIGKMAPLRTEIQFAGSSDRDRWVELLAAPQRDANGTTIGFIGVAIDITEQQRASHALKESEQRFQSLANLSPAGIFRTDAQGMCSYVNPAWCRMAGIGETDALGEGWGQAVHPGDLDSVGTGWASAVSERKSFRAEFRWRHPDGSIIWVDVLARPEWSEDGSLRGYIGVVLDITERKEFEKQIAERDKELSILAQNATDALLRIDLSGHCLYASPSSQEVLGVPPDQLIGVQTAGRFHPDDEERMAKAFAQLSSGVADRIAVSYRFRQPDQVGNERWFEATAALLRQPDSGQPKEIIASIRDISERKQMEIDLIEARRNAEAAAAAKATFLANMSHEIRTPMNGVIGFTEMLLDGPLNLEQRGNAQLIAESGKAMMQILNDILDISKIDAGQMPIAREAIDLRHKLNSCVRLLEPSARQKSLGFTLHVDEAVPAWVLADPLRVRQIVMNLVGNALKFTSQGAINIHAAVEREDNQDILSIAVEDTGIGIPEHRLEAIFQEFSQADDSTARTFGGTGLGLTISSQLAKLMGGELQVSSQEGVGSTFTFRIPLLPAEKPDKANALPEPDDQTLGYARPPRVLAAEDHDINQALIVSMAGRLGAAVSIAPNGAEVVRMAYEAKTQGRPFDLVLMDMQMPVMDGLAATRQMRDSGITAVELPILALTANAYHEDIERCLQAGMQGHLAKPLRLRELRDALQKWLPLELPAGAVAEPEQPEQSLQQRYEARRDQTLQKVFALSSGAPPDRAEIEALAEALHKLAGTAGMFGDEQLGDLARAQEDALLNADDGQLAEAIVSAQEALASWRGNIAAS